MKEFNQEVFIVEYKGVSRLILPTNAHCGRTKVAVPCIPNVLADGVEKVVHRECVKSMGVQQDIVCEQSQFFTATESG